MQSRKNRGPGSSNMCIAVAQLSGASEKRFSLRQIARTFIYLAESSQRRIIFWSSLQDVFVLLLGLTVLACRHISLSQSYARGKISRITLNVRRQESDGFPWITGSQRSPRLPDRGGGLLSGARRLR